LVTLALKVNSLVGIKQAPDSLALVAGTGALLAMVGNPFFGKMSDRTASRAGMRRPWMVIGLVGGSLGILIVALAPNIAVVLAGWPRGRSPPGRCANLPARFTSTRGRARTSPGLSPAASCSFWLTRSW